MCNNIFVKDLIKFIRFLRAEIKGKPPSMGSTDCTRTHFIWVVHILSKYYMISAVEAMLLQQQFMHFISWFADFFIPFFRSIFYQKRLNVITHLYVKLFGNVCRVFAQFCNKIVLLLIIYTTKKRKEYCSIAGYKVHKLIVH